MKSILNYILVSFCLFFAPIKGLLIAVGVAIALDTIFGIFKAIRIKEEITSRRMSNIVSKFVLYEMAILLLFAMDKFLLGEFFKIWFEIDNFFTKVVSIILIFIEMTSIKENFEVAFNVNIWKLLKTTIQRAKYIKNEIE
jgi:hypothetical protein